MRKKLSLFSIIIFCFIFFININTVQANSKKNNYVIKTVKVRDSKTNKVVAIFYRGEYIYGYNTKNWVYFKYKDRSVKVSRKYLTQKNPIELYVKYTVNVRNINGNIVGEKTVGKSIKGVKIGNYYRYYDKGVRFIPSVALTKSKIKPIKAVAKKNVNIRNIKNRIVDVLKLGDYIEGYRYGEYLYFINKGKEYKVSVKFLQLYNPIKMYVKQNGTRVRNNNLKIIGIKNKGQSMNVTKVGDYYRYYDRGVKLIWHEMMDKKYVSPSSPKLFTLDDFQWMGIINWEGYKFTYYSESVLPGWGLVIPGRHINFGGYVTDKDGYIVLASNPEIPMGAIINTPFGYMGKVYDTCPSCSLNWFDVYIK